MDFTQPGVFLKCEKPGKGKKFCYETLNFSLPADISYVFDFKRICSENFSRKKFALSIIVFEAQNK